MERIYLQFPYWPGDVGEANVYWATDTTIPFVTDIDNLELAANWLHIYLSRDCPAQTVEDMGAKWDPCVKKWYIPPGTKRAPFIKWLTLDSPSYHTYGLVFPNVNT